ncbi:Soluble lamin-associated protein of 75 kDa [Calypte anna]|uniref:Soluble lamin-associated protein of 75 kDa n=1 Tax=Calypte anna TaxID=9244 RepID=A0A091ISU8_CALAN|nr:Soluble lamin-associated protein of 75 kDa [Calypte anna]
MPFPVDILTSSSHEDLRRSSEEYMSKLMSQNPYQPQFLSLPGHGKIPISLSTVGYLPLYGEDQTHKILGLFAPPDCLTAVALYLADQWWSSDDIVRTSAPDRQGFHQVKSVGERVVLYVLNRIIYRKQEMEEDEVPFLCHRSNDYAKILWKKGEAIGFYSVKLKGSAFNSNGDKKYGLSVLDTVFVRKKHRGKDSLLTILEDFVDSFNEKSLGLRYPLSPLFAFSCKQYLEKYPNDKSLLWEVEGVGKWFQRVSIKKKIERETLRIAEEKTLQKETETKAYFQEASLWAGEQKTDLETQLNVGTQSSKSSFSFTFPGFVWTQSSQQKCPRTGKRRQESEPGTSQGNVENALLVSESRLELPAHTPEDSEDLVEKSTDDSSEDADRMVVENKVQSASAAGLHLLPTEKKKPLNGEVTEETGKTSHVSEEKTVNEVQSGEPEVHSENQGEESVVDCVPVILESSAKPSDDTLPEKDLNENDSEVLAEESTILLIQDSGEQQESEKTTTENASASASKEESSDNGLPRSVVIEAMEESSSENGLEDPNEAGHGQLTDRSVLIVEVEGVSFQQSAGQEGQKNELEEHSEAPVEQAEPSTQTAMEQQAADSSSEEAEIEVPVVDRRPYRRRARGYKGPPRKKGKPA